MDYEATDRYMSSWVVSCVHNRTRFYLTDERLATDILKGAAVYRWEDQAQDIAIDEIQDEAWKGQFAWTPIRTAEAVSL